ncbi:hypothetical protein Tco_0889509 [Tanacetum coccineum]
MNGYGNSERKFLDVDDPKSPSLRMVQAKPPKTTIKELSLEEHGATMENMQWKRLKIEDAPTPSEREIRKE